MYMYIHTDVYMYIHTDVYMYIHTDMYMYINWIDYTYNIKITLKGICYTLDARSRIIFSPSGNS